MKQKVEKTMYGYIQNLLAYNCMPTLLKMKPSTILNIQKRQEKAEVFFHLLQREIAHFGCEYEYILETKTSHIILIYQAEMLQSQLENKDCENILASFGYYLGERKIEDALIRLKERYHRYMMERKDFPDEIGIFFGYPIEDVKAYIENNGKNYKRCGFWKVYCNVERAEQTFHVFRCVREAAVQAISTGRALTELEGNYQIA